MTSFDIDIQGREELVRRLRAMAGPRLRSVARKVTSTSMRPVLGKAKALAPVGPSGRLRASLGQLATSNRRGDAFSSRVGTRRDFTYRDEQGQRMVSGRGKVRDKALARGFTQDKRTAQQYARLIEFGSDSRGRMRRKAGGAHFLDQAILSQSGQIITTVASELRRHIEST